MICRLPLRRIVLLVLFSLGVAPQLANGAASADKIWQSVDTLPQARAGLRQDIQPTEFKAFTVDRGALGASLAKAPIEFTRARAANEETVITLPKPDGSFARFRIEEVALMEPALAAKFPGIKTYRGRGLDDPMALLHLDVNPRTLHAQVLSPSGVWYIDPYWQNDGSLYMSYLKSDLLRSDRQLRCLVEGENSKAGRVGTEVRPPATNNANSGKMLRTYRIAFATSTQYSMFHGGANMDVPMILAAIMTMNNRVSGVYETELGIRMVLVANQEAIIATVGNPTPYSDTPGDIGTNPAFLDQKIGEANYDIGHVVTVGSGGVAGLGVVCRGFDVASGGSAKARGTTGFDPPVGDAFWIDFVAHEIGHQFGGNHTFDGTGTNCGTNQNEGTAYEPGGGTTIQAYAGICGDQNLQLNSDPYFQFISLEEIFGYATSGIGGRTPATLQGKASSGPQPEATPSSGTLNPTGPNVTWMGTATGGAAMDEETCMEGVTCDTYEITLSGTPADWRQKIARITFTWPSPVDDYDIFVHKGAIDGPLVDSSASSSQPEIITLDPASPAVQTGKFFVRVVYFLVAPPAQQYTAVATAVDQSNTEPAPSCAVLTPTGNNPPTVDAGADFTIPARTPFSLTAAGTDPDGDLLTYCWEQSDLGPGPRDTNLPDDGFSPIIRSYLPTTSPTRIVPRLQELLANQTQTRGEKLPTTTRELNFRITARDNIFGGHGFDAMKINVVDSGAGFEVTAPNTNLVSYPGGSMQTITWNVANTAVAPIGTSNVNILLSTNGGNSFQYLLLANTPNDGSETVSIPIVNSTNARVKVEAVGNIFFDISNANFSIVSLDTDADGIPDAFETANGLNPNDPTDAAQDRDGDGTSNFSEFVADTNVNDPTSLLKIVSIERTSASAAVIFTTSANRRYLMEAAPAVTGPWTSVSGDIPGTGNPVRYDDASGGREAAPPRSQRFYRARVFQ